MRNIVKVMGNTAAMLVLLAGMAHAAGTSDKSADAAKSSGAAATADTSTQASMEIPKSGQVDRLGTVTRVIDNKTFVLRDQYSDNSVDVHTTNAYDLQRGQRVRVMGTAQSEALGIGHEIVKAAVVPLSDTAKGVGGPFEPVGPAGMDNGAGAVGQSDINKQNGAMDNQYNSPRNE